MLNQVSWIKRPQEQDAQADRSLTEKVSAIIERVKAEGDTALRAFRSSLIMSYRRSLR